VSDAQKHDGGKPPVSLIPGLPLIEIAKVLAFGAKKYDRHNWRGGMKWSRLLDAAMRHLMAFNEGEDNDPETGYSHLAHAGCCILFLLQYVLVGSGEDDRYPTNIQPKRKLYGRSPASMALPIDPADIEAMRKEMLLCAVCMSTPCRCNEMEPKTAYCAGCNQDQPLEAPHECVGGRARKTVEYNEYGEHK
jgi:hypothetical protein